MALFFFCFVLFWGFFFGDCFGQKVQNLTMNRTGSVHLPAHFSGTKAIYLKPFRYVALEAPRLCFGLVDSTQ